LFGEARDGCYNSVRRAFMKQVLANSGYIERNELIPWTVGESENTARFLEQIRPVRQLVVAGMVEGFFPATLAAQRLRSMGLLAGFAFIGYARREEEAGQYAAQTVFIHEQDIPRLACLPDRQTLFVDDVIQHGETINAVSNALYVRFGITHINTAFLRDLRQKQR
ncbi:MAG: phosphoribosyltransferase, partial [Candidatus Marsarchaeota archaeon]|nr:phosphoribosyltransferase [Candidatus Marsarchaeota archaeon]